MPKYRKMLQLNIPALNEMMDVLSTQSKTTICNWAIACGERELLPLWEKECPGDLRPHHALSAAEAWLRGEVKLPEVKAIILNECHAAAREKESAPVAQATARAIGQAASCIHAPTHSLGIALYGALALAYDEVGIDTPWPAVEACAACHCERLLESLKAICVENEENPAKMNWNC